MGIGRTIVHRAASVKGEFDRDQRSSVLAPVQKRKHLFSRLGLHESRSRGDAGFFKRTAAVSTNGWVRVVMCDDDLLHTRPHQRLRAWRRAAKVVARFECYVRHGAVGRVSLFFRVVNGHLFSVKAAKMVVPTLSDDRVVLDQNTTNERIGADLPTTSLGEQQCVLHERVIVLRPIIAHRPPTDPLFMTACMGSGNCAKAKTSIYSD